METKCIICNKPILDPVLEGNNPWPLALSVQGVCCSECNKSMVVPVRLSLSKAITRSEIGLIQSKVMVRKNIKIGDLYYETGSIVFIKAKKHKNLIGILLEKIEMPANPNRIILITKGMVAHVIQKADIEYITKLYI